MDKLTILHLRQLSREQQVEICWLHCKQLQLSLWEGHIAKALEHQKNLRYIQALFLFSERQLQYFEAAARAELDVEIAFKKASDRLHDR